MNSFNKSEYQEFEILKQVDSSPLLNNRKAASRLGVSVKLAHDILSRMVSKGLLHIKKENSRRWDYFLTPSGIAEKAKLTMSFVNFSMQFYKEARKRSAQVCRNLSESGVNTVSLLGSNEMSEIVYLGIQEWKLNLKEIFALPGENQEFMGLNVKPLEDLKETTSEAIIVCIYNPDEPMNKNDFLPEGIQRNSKMHWMF